LNRCYDGTPTHVVTVALNATLNQFAGFPLPASGRGVGEGRPRAVTGQHTGIPQQLFHDLISAFEQDQRVSDYDTFEQLVDYCRRSANPVGRLVLHLFECCDAKNAALSDEVCTGLQLANFWQDVARDAAIGRCYLPREDRERFANHRDLIRFEVERTRGYFQRGRALLPRLPRRARMDVALFISGGDAVLDAIAAQGYDVLTRRPVITKRKKAMLLARALCGL
jgi:squalene synthase HpnC